MLGINTLINTAILQLETTSTTNYFKKQVSPVYQEAYTQDNILTNLGGNLEVVVLLPLLLIYLRQTSIMLTEKESKVKESMFIMGMRGGNYYFSWFVRYFVALLVTHIICTLIAGKILTHISFFTMLILFLLFDVVIIIQSFFIQVFLTRAKMGIVMALLFFLLQFIVSLLATNSDNPSTSLNSTFSIIPHAAFIIAWRTLLFAQSYQINPSFSDNLNNYALGTAVLSFIFNALFYLVLTWYLDQVVPN